MPRKRKQQESLVVVRGDKVIVIPKPPTHHLALRGLGARLYPKNYLENERKSWD